MRIEISGRLILRATLLLCLATPLGAAGDPPLTGFRNIDGTGNNTGHPEWGSAGITLLRMSLHAYEDGSGLPIKEGLPGARSVSNLVSAQAGDMPGAAGAANLLWQWGQFLDHDLALTLVADPPEPFDVPVPAGDAFFDPGATGAAVIPLLRSIFEMQGGVREQINSVTAWVDASQVYGSDGVRAAALRMMDGTGRLATSKGKMLPFNTAALPNAPDPDDPSFHLAGDIRSNEQVGLTAMHTIFVREHNRWARRIARLWPSLDDEGIYQTARAIVGAEMQAITYREFIPILLGPGALEPYTGYRPGVNPAISNEFATSAYRIGHTMIPEMLPRLKRNGQPIASGPLPLAGAFFAPEMMAKGTDMDAILRGLASSAAQEVDGLLVDALRNFMFGAPGAGGLDLASLNIQRGRDHGLPRYNQMRVEMGLAPATSFADVTSSVLMQGRLASAYRSVEAIDAWVGGLVEDHLPGAMVGELCFVVLKDQFERLRDGDRFWYESHLPPWLVNLVNRQSLATIIRKNTSIGREIQDEPLLMPPGSPPPDDGAAGRHP
jgi:hypothetical protein